MLVAKREQVSHSWDIFKNGGENLFLSDFFLLYRFFFFFVKRLKVEEYYLSHMFDSECHDVAKHLS